MALNSADFRMKKFSCFFEMLLLVLVEVFPNALSASSLNDEQCYLYAAPKIGTAKAGITHQDLQPDLAIPACEAAIRKAPESPELLFMLGRAYDKAGRTNEALAVLKRSAASNYPPANGLIGHLYESGSGVPKNQEVAIDWFRRGAEAGDLTSQFTLGQIYENGRGVSQDYVQAFRWYKMAADRGLAEGQDSVGFFYSKGFGVERNPTEAMTWTRKAAEQGMAIAEHNLAVMYETGSGVATDHEQALKWELSAKAHGYNAKSAAAPKPNKNAQFPVVIARGLNGAPGAIVCRDLPSVTLVFRLFNNNWEDRFQDKLLGAQATLLRGTSAPARNPEAYGCKLVREGTVMHLESEQPVPIVSFEESGVTYRGVTMSVMLQSKQANSHIGGGNTPSMFGSRQPVQ